MSSKHSGVAKIISFLRFNGHETAADFLLKKFLKTSLSFESSDATAHFARLALKCWDDKDQEQGEK